MLLLLLLPLDRVEPGDPTKVDPDEGDGAAAAPAPPPPLLLYPLPEGGSVITVSTTVAPLIYIEKVEFVGEYFPTKKKSELVLPLL